MEIVRGVIGGAQKIVAYGPEGIGKSTFASMFPNPLFIDIEGSTTHMNVARSKKPTSWTMLLEQVLYVNVHPEICRTLVIDSADWAEQLCCAEVCAKSQKNSIEDFGYGKGYIYLAEEYGRLLNMLSELIQMGINVVFTAHATMRKFEQPDESGAYDRWELKLQKKTAPLLKEWADMLLFANYKTYVIKEDSDSKKAKAKAKGGKRVMYTAHHVCWDAKNRQNMPEEMDFDYANLKKYIEESGQTVKAAPKEPIPIQKPSEATIDTAPIKEAAEENEVDKSSERQEPHIKALEDLMGENDVSAEEIQLAVSQKGYYPKETPIANYDKNFVSGVLVGAWKQVYGMVLENRDKHPF